MSTAEAPAVLEPLWGVAEVAAHFRVTTFTVARWVKEGRLPKPVQVGGPRGRQLWRPQTIRDFVARLGSTEPASCA